MLALYDCGGGGGGVAEGSGEEAVTHNATPPTSSSSHSSFAEYILNVFYICQFILNLVAKYSDLTPRLCIMY